MFYAKREQEVYDHQEIHLPVRSSLLSFCKYLIALFGTLVRSQKLNSSSHSDLSKPMKDSSVTNDSGFRLKIILYKPEKNLY